MAVTSASMNSNTAVFGQLCAESGYTGAGQGYPSSAEQLAAFYQQSGVAGGGGGGSTGSGGSSSGGGGGGGSSGEPSSPSPYGGGNSGVHSSERHHPPETKYEPSHSPTSGIISSDNGLQYANLDGSELKGGAGAGYPGYPGSGHHQAAAYQQQLAQHYAHHYGKGSISTSTLRNII